MKIVNIKELAHMPNGTVFSEIVDEYFLEYYGDMDIDGLNILCGHDDKDSTESSGHFNGVLHMLNYVSVCRDEQNKFAVDGYSTVGDIITDTCDYDYDESSYFVVYEESDILKIIDNLTWALNGCRN